MSRAVKILWGVLGSLFVLGIILTAVGFALGATGSAWLDREGLHFGPRQVNTVELAESESEPFENLDIQLVEADIEFVSASSYGYEFSYSGTLEPSIEISGGTLRIIENQDMWHWNIGILGFWNSFGQQAKLTIYVPSDALLDTVNLYTASGETTLDGSQVAIKNLDCKSASGNIYLKNLSLETLLLDVASGDVSMDGVAAKQATIDMISGGLSSTETQLRNLILNMASGSAKVQGEITESLELRMISGEANFELSGSEDDYSFYFDRISGDIRVNGRSVDGSSLPGSISLNEQGATRGHIDVEVTSGSVNINLKQAPRQA